MSGTAIRQYSSAQMYARLLQHPAIIAMQSEMPWQPLNEFQLLRPEEQDERIRSIALVNLGIFQESLHGKKNNWNKRGSGDGKISRIWI